MAQSRMGSTALGITVLGIAVVLLLALFSIRIVGVGEVGVIHTFGVVDTNPRQPGLTFKAPWAALETMSVRTQQFTMGSVAEEQSLVAGDTVRTLTSEGLTVGLDLTVWFALQPDRAPIVFSTIGPDYRGIIIRPAIRNAIRDVVAQYTAEALYTEGRENVGVQIQDQLISDLNPRGVTIERVLLRDVALPPLIQQAIETKIAAEQAIQERRFRVEEATEEANRRVEEATGIRDAQELINSTLTPEYLQFLYIESLREQKAGNVIYVPVNPGTGLPGCVNAGQKGGAASP
ncbi:MAG: prohibitin family protein [Chloroflexi bacterium]|nr:prohibitin family protein [Chloroflexota bacterium]